MKLSSRAYKLYEIFDQPGCPVCRLTAKSVHHFLDSSIYEYVNKKDTHLAVRAARGYCPRHAWHIKDAINASALGIAVLYEGLVRTILKDMGEPDADGGRRQVGRASDALHPQAECPACVHQRTVQDHLLRNLIAYLDQDEFAAGFAASEGLCLPHLRLALDSVEGSASRKSHLLSIQYAIWSQLQRDLAEFKRKNDANFADEDFTPGEASSPRRAIELMAGAKGVF